MKKILSKLYYYIIKLRLFLYKTQFLKSRKAQLPTFCVGNANVGGSGKTPFTQFLVSRLIELGYKPAILLRGYKGEVKNSKIVNEKDSVKTVGDEAIMHFDRFNSNKVPANKIPVVVSPNRYKGIELIKEATNANCVVMDDGMQHLALRANHYFLLIPKDLNNEEMLPSGSLREPLYEAEKRANTIIKVNKAEPFEYKNSSKVILNFDIKSYKLVDLISKEEVKKEVVSSVDAICAIANPEHFRESIKSLGIKINNFYAFSDHYKFNTDDISKLSYPVITTSKDAKKIAEHVGETNKVFILEQNYDLAELEKLDSIIKDTLG